MKRSEISRRTPLARGASQLKRVRLKARPKRKLFDDRTLREAWIASVLEQAPKVGDVAVCSCCGMPPKAENPLQGHHVTEQQAIKNHVASLGLPAKEAAEVLAYLLWDVRNGVAVLQRCHSRHTTATQRFSVLLVTDSHREFARELGLERLIDVLYASAPVRVAA